MLPAAIPLFPLPNVVLFPNVLLALHIFEPRYRAMISDVLEADRIVGIVLLRPDQESELTGRPPVFPVGCAGTITHTERLRDGRYNIVLRGVVRFRVIEEEVQTRPYRVARVEAAPDVLAEVDRSELRRRRSHIEALLAATSERAGARPRLPRVAADEDLVNALAQHLELEPLERQALLERDHVLDRCRGLIELLGMKALMPRGPSPGSVH